MRSQVSTEQILILLEYLKEHSDLAKGINKGVRRQTDLWHECANKLNSVKNGAVKDKKGWSKFWCDLKYRTKRRYLEIKVAKESNKPIVADDIVLSPIENTILNVISDGNMDELSIKTDPLDVVYEEFEEENESNNEKESKYNVMEVPPKRRHSEDNDTAASSSKNRRRRLNDGDSDNSDLDDASRFLNMEKQKLECTKDISNNLHTIAVNIKRLTDIMSDIRDVLVKK